MLNAWSTQRTWRIPFVFLASTWLCPHLLIAQNWNQFRGPNGDGKSVAKSLPVEFDEAINVRWKAAIPDSGWSSPVVWEIWKKRLGGDHWASPIYADGKLYFSSKRGDVTVVEALRKEPEVLARNRMNASFIASPAVSGSSLILRSTSHLYCVANGHRRTPEQVAADVYPEHLRKRT